MSRRGPYTDLGPPERTTTAREALLAALREAPLTLRELSQRAGLAEREVATHLPHLERSLRAQEEYLVVEAARCLACNFEFSRRTRFTAPSRCPACKSERIEPPTFRISGEKMR